MLDQDQECHDFAYDGKSRIHLQNSSSCNNNNNNNNNNNSSNHNSSRSSSSSTNNNNNNCTRIARITTLLSTTKLNDTGVRAPLDFWIYYDATAWMAAKDFNNRNTRIVRDLPTDCNVQLELTMYDAQFSPMIATSLLAGALQVPNDQQPAGLIGAIRSAVSRPLAVLSGTYELPQISAQSTSAALDAVSLYPYFGRTIPTNAADARALCIYLHSLGVHRLGVMYIQDEYGSDFLADIVREATPRKIIVTPAPIQNNVDSIQAAIDLLVATEGTFFFGIFNSFTWQIAMRNAYQAGIMGRPGYLWLLSETAVEFASDTLALDPVDDADLIAALSGIGYVNLDIPENEAFTKALQEIPESLDLINELKLVHPDLYPYDEFELYGSTAVMSQLHLLTYDAVMAMGMAICNASQEFPTGPEIFDSFRQLKFQGASGDVRFDTTTGTRLVDGVNFAIMNVVPRDTLVDGKVKFENIKSIVVNFVKENPLEVINPFIYSDGTTVPPVTNTPSPDLNLIQPAAMAFGYGLFAVVSITSIGWAVFTHKYRKTPIVKASQPFFLFMMCIGTFIMGLSILMSGFQEPMPVRLLNFACVAYIWCFSIGFVTAFCAIFCKMWRLNQLNYKATRFRRAIIMPKDVLYPFGIMMSANIIILTLWTILNPPLWIRSDLANYYNEFGEPSASVGLCRADPEKAGGTLIFMCLYFAINGLALIFANYQSYIARNYPSAYNEGYYIAISVGILLEAGLVGGPVLLLVRDNPSSKFVVQAIVISAVCLGILTPLFVPKYLARNEKEMVEVTRAIPNHSSRSKRSLMSSDDNQVENIRQRASSLINPELPYSRPAASASLRMVSKVSVREMNVNHADVIPSEDDVSRPFPVFRRRSPPRNLLPSRSLEHSSEEFGS